MGFAHRLTGPPSLDAATTGHLVVSRLRAAEEHALAEAERHTTLVALIGTLPPWVDAIGSVDDRLRRALASSESAEMPVTGPPRTRAAIARPTAVQERRAPTARVTPYSARAAGTPIDPPAVPSARGLVTGMSSVTGRAAEPSGRPPPQDIGVPEAQHDAARASASAGATPVVVSTTSRPLDILNAPASASARSRGTSPSRQTSGPDPAGVEHRRVGEPQVAISDRVGPAASPSNATPGATSPRVEQSPNSGQTAEPARVRSLSDLAHRYRPGATAAPVERLDCPPAHTASTTAASPGFAINSAEAESTIGVGLAGTGAGGPAVIDPIGELEVADPGRSMFLATQLAALVGDATADEARRQGIDLEGIFA